jgi:hypothetical protein
MSKLKIRRKFRVAKPQVEKRTVISLHVSAQLDEMAQEAAEEHGVTKQDLIRQMTTHCLCDLGYDAPTDTDSRPPTKRVYSKKNARKKPRLGQ